MGFSLLGDGSGPGCERACARCPLCGTPLPVRLRTEAQAATLDVGVGRASRAVPLPGGALVPGQEGVHALLAPPLSLFPSLPPFLLCLGSLASNCALDGAGRPAHPQDVIKALTLSAAAGPSSWTPHPGPERAAPRLCVGFLGVGGSSLHAAPGLTPRSPLGPDSDIQGFRQQSTGMNPSKLGLWCLPVSL